MAYVIPTTFTAVDLFSGPVARMQKSLLGLTTIAGVRGGAMTNQLNDISNRSMQVAANSAMIGTAIVAPLGLATKAAVKFEQEMGNVGTLIDTTSESLQQIGDGVQDMSRRIAKPIADLSTGMYQIRSAGIEAGNGINQAFGVLESSGKLAIAGLSTTTEAVNAVTSAMNVFKSEGLTSEQIANSFFKTVQGGKTTMAQLSQSFGQNAAIIHEAGVSLLEMNAATAALTINGISASQAQVELAQSVTALIKPSTNLQTVYDALGFSGENAFKEIVQATGGLVPAMEAINKQARTMGVTMGEDFGNKRALIANIELTGNAHDSYLRMLNTQRDGQDTLSGKFAAQSNTAAAQMQLFENSLNRLGIAFGNALIPPINTLMKVLEPVMDAFAWFGKTFPEVTTVIVGLAGGMGVLALAISGTAFVFGALTKATWLCNIAISATEGVMTLWGVASFAAAQGMGSLTIATGMFEAVIVPLLPEITLIAGALALFNSVSKSTYNTNVELNDSLTRTKDGFAEIKKPISDATLALSAYNEAMDDYNNKQGAISRLEYHQKYNQAHNRTDTWGDFIRQIPDAIRAGNGIMDEAPKKSDFPGLAASVGEGQASSNSVQPVNLYVSVDKDGNVSMDSKPKKNGVYINKTHTIDS
jgi:TP901 family phage tail tape measure protein